jgi:hypothetical protein
MVLLMMKETLGVKKKNVQEYMINKTKEKTSHSESHS